MNNTLTNNFSTELPTGYVIHGIDVSSYQSRINWAEVGKVRPKTFNITFAFIKATEGKTLSDKFYNYNMTQARKHNIICGSYHYYNPRVNSTEQAENFISMAKINVGDLPPVLDIEVESLYGKKNMIKGIQNWLEIVENHYHMKPIIYTSNTFHKNFLSGEEFKEYPFWIAHYYQDDLKTSSNWIFWQHSNKAHVSGITGYVDLSVYNGSLQELKQLCKK
jgi:lysozyme